MDVGLGGRVHTCPTTKITRERHFFVFFFCLFVCQFSRVLTILWTSSGRHLPSDDHLMINSSSLYYRKIWERGVLWHGKSEQFAKVFSTKIYFSPIHESFLPLKFPTIWYMLHYLSLLFSLWAGFRSPTVQLDKSNSLRCSARKLDVRQNHTLMTNS